MKATRINSHLKKSLRLQVRSSRVSNIWGQDSFCRLQLLVPVNCWQRPLWERRLGSHFFGSSLISLLFLGLTSCSTPSPRQVQADATLVATNHLPPETLSVLLRSVASEVVAVDRMFDLDDIGAVVGQDLTGERTSQHRRRIDDAKVVERPGSGLRHTLSKTKQRFSQWNTLASLSHGQG